MLRLLFTTSSTFADAAIRAFDGGRAGHVAVQIGEDAVIDSTFLGGGVRLQPLETFLRGRRLVHAIDVTLPDEPAARVFLADQIGKGYDWTALVGFLAWRDWAEPDSWYCSELAAAALLAGGWTLADRHSRVGVRLLREVGHARAGAQIVSEPA